MSNEDWCCCQLCIFFAARVGFTFFAERVALSRGGYASSNFGWHIQHLCSSSIFVLSASKKQAIAAGRDRRTHQKSKLTAARCGTLEPDGMQQLP